ncbi:nuclear transport factor 2 family protein [Aestuariivirga litoralis]|uniref:nuclear transport factor 2 family protein n=1 Tax=Aestuariivirga litoralis TaxID=2650924 RepID=UPI0018C52DD2|nr:nuclear transport factor 2 family protein [Aestuariivirga litoralis]MBG1232278.1 nuclear transport factor 2 family protein [Aestuariivirga litoralis]
MHQLKQRLANYTAALNRFDMDTVERMFAEDAVYASPGLASVIQGRAAIMAAFRAYFAKHPDQVNGDEDVREEGRSVTARWTLRSSSSQRSGMQVIRFNEAGEIDRIDVTDD